MRTVKLILILIVLAPSCSTNTPTDKNLVEITRSAPIPTLSLTGTLQPLATQPELIRSPTPVPSISAAASEQLLFHPRIEKYCPQRQELALTELDIPSNFRLVFSSGGLPNFDRPGIAVLSPYDMDLIQLPDTSPPDGSVYSYGGISPGGDQILIGKEEKGQYTEEDHIVSETSLWVINLDGGLQDELLSFRFEGSRYLGSLIIQLGDREWKVEHISCCAGFEWMEEGVIVTGRFTESPPIAPHFPVFILDMNTMEGKVIDFEELYGDSNDLYGDFHFNGNSYVIYSKQIAPEEAEFILKDRTNYSEQRVFHWLSDMDWILRNNIYARLEVWQGAEGGVNVVVVQPYGFDIGQDLDINVITKETSYEDVMTPVYIPPGSDFLSEDGRARLGAGPFLSDDANLFLVVTEKEHYIFDVERMTIRDYCLEDVVRGRYFTSPDGRFLAWHEYHRNEEGVIDGIELVAVLELDRGYIARIRTDQVFLGWGEISER